MIRYLLILVAILLPLNMVGLDPADYLILALAPLLFIAYPQNIVLPRLSPGIIPLIILFLISFGISHLYGYENRFTVAIIINFMVFYLIYYSLFHCEEPVKFGYIISISFVCLNIIFFLLQLIGIEFIALFEIFRDGRFLGSTGDPNFTGFTSLFVFIYFLDRLIGGRSDGASRVPDVLFMTLGAVALLLSESRASWGAGAAALLSYFAVMSGGRHKFVIPGLFIVIAAVITVSLGERFGDGEFGALSQRFQSIFAQTGGAEAERFEFFYSRMSLAVGLDHPFGVGPGMTASYTGLINADGMPIGAHNSLVQILTEMGWLAFASVVAIFCVSALRILPRALDGWMLNDVSYRVIFAMMMGQMVFSMGHDMIAWRVAWLVPSLAICAAFARKVRADDEGAKVMRSRSKARQTTLAHQRSLGGTH